MDKQQKREQLKEWRKRRSAELDLPSGLAVTLRHVSLIDLAGAGKVPETLSTLVDQAREGSVSLAEFNQLAELINLVARNAIIDPPLLADGQEPDDDHLSLDELDWDDRIAIFNECNKGAIQLEPFRSQSAADVVVAQPGDGLRSEAVLVVASPG